MKQSVPYGFLSAHDCTYQRVSFSNDHFCLISSLPCCFFFILSLFPFEWSVGHISMYMCVRVCPCECVFVIIAFFHKQTRLIILHIQQLGEYLMTQRPAIVAWACAHTRIISKTLNAIEMIRNSIIARFQIEATLNQHHSTEVNHICLNSNYHKHTHTQRLINEY